VSNVFVTLPDVKVTLTSRSRGLPRGMMDKMVSAIPDLLHDLRRPAVKFHHWTDVYIVEPKNPIPATHRWPPHVISVSHDRIQGALLTALKNLTGKCKCNRVQKKWMRQNLPEVSRSEARRREKLHSALHPQRRKKGVLPGRTIEVSSSSSEETTSSDDSSADSTTESDSAGSTSADSEI
jgi:hypothetical protein